MGDARRVEKPGEEELASDDELRRGESAHEAAARAAQVAGAVRGAAAGDAASLGAPADEHYTAQAAERQAAVVEAFRHAWDGYAAHAWGADEILPVTGQPSNSWGGLGATMVDEMKYTR